MYYGAEMERHLYSDYMVPYKGRIFGPQMSDSYEPVNMERMRRERLEKARRSMKEAGVSVMLLLEDANMRYTTGYSWLQFSTNAACVLLPLEGDPIVAGQNSSPLQLRREMPWIKPENLRSRRESQPNPRWKELFPQGYEFAVERYLKLLKDDLKQMGLAKEVLTLDMDSNLVETLQHAGIRTSVRPDILERAQEIKTEDEIACFRMSAALADLTHYELAKYAEPGKTELELAGYMNYVAMKHGAEPRPNCFVASGQNTHPNYRHSTTKELRIGDIFFADTIQISWAGYKSCCYRNYSCVTPPSQKAKDTMKYVVDITYAALSDCKPGNTTADMMKHWPYDDAEFCQGGGGMHGLGVLNYGPPWGGENSLKCPYELKEGQVFAIEPEKGIGDGQACRFEEMVVVTKTGCEVLTHFPVEIITVPLR